MKNIIIDSIEYELTPVIKKDYEILSYMCLGAAGSPSNQIFNRTSNGNYQWKNVRYSEEEIKRFCQFLEEASQAIQVKN
jgi:hypothetical protein